MGTIMWSLSSQATLTLSSSIQSGGKPSNNKPSHQLPRWMSQQQSSRLRSPAGNTGGGYRLVLSIGLIAGGAFTAYSYVSSNKVRREERVPASPGMRGLVASCREGDGKNDKDGSAFESSRKFERAIKRSRDLLQRAKDEVGAPGIAAAVSVDGQLVWSEGIGYADVENRTPCRPNSVFRIASISKSLAMAAAARLMEEGKLDLDKPVQEYVPSFPQKEWDGEKVSLTTRHLVSHLGGIRHYDKSYMKKKKTDDNKTAEDNQMNNSSKTSEKAVNGTNKTKSKDKNVENITTFDEMKSKKEFKTVNSALDLFKDDPLMHKPGSKYMYTTHGFTLLSAVVEGASGKDYLTYMRTMLREMGLTETIPDRHIPIIYNRARGYRYNKNGKLENCPYVDLSYKWAGGGYLSTVEDLIKFGNIMLYSFQHTANHTDKALLPGFLKKDTVEAIWKPVPIAKPKPTNEYCYAMGWSVLEKEQKHGYCRPMRHIVAHSGGAMGFTSMLTIAPNHISSDINSTTGNNSESENGDVPDMCNEPKLASASHLPKGVVVALFVNLLDAGSSKAAEGIVEAFQQCTNSE